MPACTNESNIWSMASFTVGSLYDLTTKGAFNNKKSGSFENILFNSFLTQAIILMIYDRYKTGNFKLEDINQDKKVDFKDIGITIWTGFTYFLYCYIATKSIELAPNVGYAKAITTFGVVLTTILSHYIFDSVLTGRVLIGVAMIMVGIMYVAIG